MTLLEELTQYSHNCIKDTTHVCQKHRWACERFLRDVQRAGTEEFPYVFDEEKAQRFLTGRIYIGIPKAFLPASR